MAAIDDLNAAVVALRGEVAEIATDLDTLAQRLKDALAANDSTAVAQAAADIQGQVQALKDAAARDMPAP